MKTDETRTDKAIEFLEQATDILSGLDADIDPTVNDILASIDDAKIDLSLLTFDDEGVLIEPDESEVESEFEDDEEEEEEDDEDDDT